MTAATRYAVIHAKNDEIKQLRAELERNRGDLIIEADRANRAEAERDALRALLMRAKDVLNDVAYPDGDLCVNADAEEMASSIDDYCLACRAEEAEAERDALRKSAERRLRLLWDVKENLDVAKANSGAYAFDKFAGHLPTCVSPRGDQVCQCGYSSVRFNIEALLEECNSDVEGATMNSVSAEIDAALAAKESGR